MKKILLGTAVLLCVGVAAFFLYKPASKRPLPPEPTPMASSSIMLTSGRPVPQGQKEYYNPTYHMSVLYPDILAVTEFQEGSGVITVTFENFGASKGFQIFITPFGGASISEEQFKRDIPSGIRKNLKNVTIDGATGATFYSEDESLGETAEIWFLKDGYLYEVNSFKGLDTWLSDIVQTWKFMP